MTIREIKDTSKWRIVSSSIILDTTYAVKELIDNAIDAGATNIYVDVDAKTSGCHYICVRDNGFGVDKADRDAMCMNHTTSKISSLDDLSHLKSLGFRGQALFSLATLANKKGSMEISTKTQAESVGEKWFVPKVGIINERDRRKVSCPTGSTVLIRNLMLGLRARYLHTVARATKNNEEIYRLIIHYSLIFRSIRFHFCLITIDKLGSVIKKQLQESLEPNFSRVRALSIASRLRSPAAENFFVNDNLFVSKFISLDLILPTMQPQTDVYNLKKSKRFLSVNGRVMSLQLTFGNSIAKMLNRLYRDANLVDPTTWFIDIKCDARILDVNIEPGKDDVMVKEMSIRMSQIEESLSLYFKQELRKRGYASLGDESPRDLVKSRGSVSASPVSGTSMTITAPSATSRGDHHSGEEDLTGSSGDKGMLSTDSPTLPNLKRRNTEDPIEYRDFRWKRNLNSDDPIGTQEMQSRRPSSIDDLPSGPSENDDVELAMNISLSNPFMTAKLRNFNVKQRKIEILQENNNSGQSSGSFKMNSLKSKDKNTKPVDLHARNEFLVPSIAQENVTIVPSTARGNLRQNMLSSSYDDSTLINEKLADEEAEGEDTLLMPEKLKLYSEHTEGMTQLVNYSDHNYRENAYKEELQWLTRDSDPSVRVLESLAALSRDVNCNKISLSRSKEGWYVLTAEKAS